MTPRAVVAVAIMSSTVAAAAASTTMAAAGAGPSPAAAPPAPSGPPSSQQRAAASRALREAVCSAFGASAGDSRISLGVPLPLWARDIGQPLRSRLKLHRLISSVRQEDFYAEADESSRTILRPAEGAEVAKGMSFFAVLSSDPDVIAAVHEYLRPSVRNLGCCVRTLDELPPDTELVIDAVKLSTANNDAQIIVHASLVPAARVRLTDFASALEDRPARKCSIAANADIGLERVSGGSGSDTFSVRTGDFEPDEAEDEDSDAGGSSARAGAGLDGGVPDSAPVPSTGPPHEAAPPTGGSPESLRTA